MPYAPSRSLPRRSGSPPSGGGRCLEPGELGVQQGLGGAAVDGEQLVAQRRVPGGQVVAAPVRSRRRGCGQAGWPRRPGLRRSRRWRSSRRGRRNGITPAEGHDQVYPCRVVSSRASRSSGVDVLVNLLARHLRDPPRYAEPSGRPGAPLAGRPGEPVAGALPNTQAAVPVHLRDVAAVRRAAESCAPHPATAPPPSSDRAPTVRDSARVPDSDVGCVGAALRPRGAG